MTTQEIKEFLSENREVVINFYNKEVKNYWNISLGAFMTDMLNNFRKATLGKELKKYDVHANLSSAKRRLGCFDNQLQTSYTKPYSQSNHAKAVNYYGKSKVNLMKNA